jgi:hypothetical protein
MMELWEWADSETTDGFIPAVKEPAHLTRIIPDTSPGFWAAVFEAGWLRFRNGGIEIPNFERWLGYSAKKRLQDSQRKRRVRSMSVSKADNLRTPCTVASAQSESFSNRVGEPNIHPEKELQPTVCAEIPEETLNTRARDPTKPARRARTRKAFVVPTVEEVAAHCRARGNSIDAEEFVAYYETRGWKTNKGVPVQSWKGAVITWEKMNKPAEPKPFKQRILGPEDEFNYDPHTPMDH